MLTVRRTIGMLLIVLLLSLPAWATPKKDDWISLVAVGDVMLARNVGKRISEHGPDWPFKRVMHLVRNADLAFCNLECPISSDAVKVNKPICFRADPETVRSLKNVGFNTLSLANNHSLDCGRPGLVDTMDNLKQAGIAFAGAGTTLSEAERPTFLKIGNLRVAFLGRTAIFPENSWPRPDAPGIAFLDNATIEQAVADARSKADIVIVSIHWGVEYRKNPDPEQIALAHRLIDAGASVVLGHHPHVIQPMERYHGGLIAYSLGNFVFDSPVRQCKRSAILRCRLSKAGVGDVSVIPIQLDDYRPVPIQIVRTGRN